MEKLFVQKFSILFFFFAAVLDNDYGSRGGSTKLI